MSHTASRAQIPGGGLQHRVSDVTDVTAVTGREGFDSVGIDMKGVTYSEVCRQRLRRKVKASPHICRSRRMCLDAACSLLQLSEVSPAFVSNRKLQACRARAAANVHKLWPLWA